ncbi:hypothetical protein TSAR_000678 [Trichomalopsis sarcophagae]|uniref:Uncharacterized protein n=1 Tax=Trichomalopsis sarcophagae TaxID=543379 RepID=A0A232EP65_9HYME|nr:hypothetical protein TSAR_000678 [Trichomalopsis sarcophagae]
MVTTSTQFRHRAPRYYNWTTRGTRFLTRVN